MDYEEGDTPFTYTRNKVVISKTVIEDTKDFLGTRSLRLPHQDGEDLTPFDAITLAKGISHPTFKSWAERHEDASLGFKVEYLHGNIVATELASTPHSEAIYAIVHQMASQDAIWSLQCPSEEDLPIPNQQVCTRPDVTIKPNGTHVNGPHLSQGRGFPTCIFEVGVSQSLPDLVRKLNEYYCAIPTLQLYIAIKCYPTKGMVAIVFERPNRWSPPSAVISFGLENLPVPCIQYLTQMQWQALVVGVGLGGAQCDQANMQLYRVSLPSHLVFAGRVGGIPTSAHASYFVDLYRVQQALAHTFALSSRTYI